MYIVLKQYKIVNDDENEQGHAVQVVVQGARQRELSCVMSYVLQC